MWAPPQRAQIVRTAPLSEINGGTDLTVTRLCRVRILALLGSYVQFFKAEDTSQGQKETPYVWTTRTMRTIRVMNTDYSNVRQGFKRMAAPPLTAPSRTNDNPFYDLQVVRTINNTRIAPSMICRLCMFKQGLRATDSFFDQGHKKMAASLVLSLKPSSRWLRLQKWKVDYKAAKKEKKVMLFKNGGLLHGRRCCVEVILPGLLLWSLAGDSMASCISLEIRTSLRFHGSINWHVKLQVWGQALQILV